MVEKINAPGGIRTHGLRIRNVVKYVFSDDIRLPELDNSIVFAVSLSGIMPQDLTSC